MAVVVCIMTHQGTDGAKVVTIEEGDRLVDSHADVVAHSGLYVADGSTPDQVLAAKRAAGYQA